MIIAPYLIITKNLKELLQFLRDFNSNKDYILQTFYQGDFTNQTVKEYNRKGNQIKK